jgi:hypothetical protein
MCGADESRTRDLVPAEYPVPDGVLPRCDSVPERIESGSVMRWTCPQPWPLAVMASVATSPRPAPVRTASLPPSD